MKNFFPTVAACCGAVVLALAVAPLAAAMPPDKAQSAPTVGRLEHLQRSAEQALRAGDANAASQIAAEIVEICTPRESGEDATALRLAKDDPRRIQFLFFAAQLDLGLGNAQRAEETFETIVAQSEAGSSEHLRANAFLLKLKINRGEEYLPEAVELLAQSSHLPPEHKPLGDEVQNLVFDAIIATYSSDARKPTELADQLQRIEQKMVDADVPAGIARLTQFAMAVHLARNGPRDKLEELLAQLEPVVASERVTPYRQAQYWNLLAGLKTERMQFADAFDASRRFEQSARAAERTYEAVIARDQAAYIALRLGDYAEARRLLESTRPHHAPPLQYNTEQERQVRLENAINWRVNMAKAMEGDDEFLTARALLNEAASMLENDHRTLPRLVALVNNNLGLNHYLTGDFDKAAELMQGARVAYQEMGGFEERIGEASVNAGWIALSRDDADAAAQSFERAAELFSERLSTTHPRYAEALTYQARAAAAGGQTERARELIEQAERLVYQRLCRDLSDSLSSRDRLALVQEARVHPESVVWPGTVDTYLELAHQLQISPRQQYQTVLRWKGLIERFDRLARSGDAPSGSEEREVEAKLREAYFRQVSLLQRRALQQEIERLEGRLREIRRARRSELSAGAGSRAAAVGEVASGLADGDLLVDIFQIRTFRPPSRQGLVGTARRYLAFAIDPAGRVYRLPLGDADEVDAAISNWTSAITERRRRAPAEPAHSDRQTAAADALAALVQQPILETEAALQRLIVRPDAATHLIPWAALPGTGGKRYWVENIQVQLCNSVPTGDRAPVPRPSPSLLVVGGVDFGELNDYPPLPGSRKEKRHVRQQFEAQFAGGHVIDLEQREGTESALLREMPGRDYVHLATHGFYRRRDETDVFGVTGATALLQTGLVLAPPSEHDAGHDQFLTAAEIGEVDLSGTSLVMLSACESTLGQSLAGQGVRGMLGSFHTAGASHVVGTLWIVDDEATANLVARFYHYLWNENQTPAKALRAAQLEMISGPAKSQVRSDLASHPYAWAAFVCSVK